MRVRAEARHDMGRPVASMSALATAALAEPGLSEPTRVRLEQLLGQVKWLADLIRDPPRPARPATPDACRTDLFGVVSEAVVTERVTWPGTVTIVGEARPVHTAVHSVLLRRVVANLLSNATRAAGPSGAVSVDIRCNRCTAVIIIEDTGPGFGKIEPGLGLGLVTVSRCLASYGGRLYRERGAGGGVRVSLWLPRATSGQETVPGAVKRSHGR